MELLTNYYGIDWLIFALITLHIYYLGSQKSVAFPIAMLATFLGAIFGLMTHSLATVLMNIVFFFLHLQAYAKWTIKDIKEK